MKLSVGDKIRVLHNMSDELYYGGFRLDNYIKSDYIDTIIESVHGDFVRCKDAISNGKKAIHKQRIIKWEKKQ